ncbi:MAG: hypothetical protein P9X24_04495 [Candidatus Hatepunaea meridiana]|nr:hypothetical protein [Candidatus Hatepunaea meridiana]
MISNKAAGQISPQETEQLTISITTALLAKTTDTQNINFREIIELYNKVKIGFKAEVDTFNEELKIEHRKQIHN